MLHIIRQNNKTVRKLQSVHMSMIFQTISDLQDEIKHNFEDYQEEAQEADIFSDATICWEDRS